MSAEGFFACEDDQEAASALLQAAEDGLRAWGLEVLGGPTSFSTNDEAGLLVSGFETPSTLMMPHNPPYYARLLERARLRKVKDLLAYQSTGDRLPPRLVEGAEGLRRRYDIRLRTLDLARFAGEVELVKRLYNAAWERNWGFVPMTDEEIDFLAAQLRPVVVKERVAFAERAGEVPAQTALTWTQSVAYLFLRPDPGRRPPSRRGCRRRHGPDASCSR